MCGHILLSQARWVAPNPLKYRRFLAMAAHPCGRFLISYYCLLSCFLYLWNHFCNHNIIISRHIIYHICLTSSQYSSSLSATGVTRQSITPLPPSNLAKVVRPRILPFIAHSAANRKFCFSGSL